MLHIYGAGMAGLIAANKLRRFKPIIIEAQPELPRNHDAVLRFRSDAVSRATGIPFARVRVQKGVYAGGRFVDAPNLALMNEYALKVSGNYAARSLSDWSKPGWADCERYIAPPDFVEQMARSCNIQFNRNVVFFGSEGDSAVPAISTIPMPIAIKMVGGDAQAVGPFAWSAVTVVQWTIKRCDLHQTIYFPTTNEIAYRVSLMGSRAIAECMYSPDPENLEGMVKHYSRIFGISESFYAGGEPKMKVQKFGKIIPIPEEGRRDFITRLTDQYNVYSLGRFATWRPILLEDVVQDVDRIEGWINARNNYLRRKENG